VGRQQVKVKKHCSKEEDTAKSSLGLFCEQIVSFIRQNICFGHLPSAPAPFLGKVCLIFDTSLHATIFMLAIGSY